VRPARSLKARALQWLAQREHSRLELRRKLMPFARAEDAQQDVRRGEGELATDDGSGGVAPPRESPAERVEAVLDWLEARHFQSQARFVESRVHARTARYGNLRIRLELKQHELALSPDAAQALAESELRRARAVRERKFPQWPEDAASRARQARFLAGRGFSPEVIARALRPARELTDDPPGPPAG
jgi:regulatory protein